MIGIAGGELFQSFFVVACFPLRIFQKGSRRRWFGPATSTTLALQFHPRILSWAQNLRRLLMYLEVKREFLIKFCLLSDALLSC